MKTIKLITLLLVLSTLSFESYASNTCYVYHQESSIATGEVEISYVLLKSYVSSGSCEAFDHFETLLSLETPELNKQVLSGRTSDGSSDCQVVIFSVPITYGRQLR